MRKRFVEKMSFYKLLDELNQLPEECALSPLYIAKVFDEKLKFIDLYVTFTRHCQDTEDPFSFTTDNNFTLLFMFKSCFNRISLQARFAFETSITEDNLTLFVFNSKILTVVDFFAAFLYTDTAFCNAMRKVQSFDNENFASINP